MNAKTTFKLFEEKKHSVRYNADKNDEMAVATTIYVNKSALPKPYPKTIIVTVEDEASE